MWVLSKFDVSLDLFNSQRSKEIALTLNGDDEDSCSIPDIHELMGSWFSSLRNHLKNVKLHFELEELNSFEVSLAKLFAENCKVLEVLHIEDGDQSLTTRSREMEA